MSSTNESNTNFVKEIHTSVNGKRFYYVDNDKNKDRRYLCNGKNDTCTNLSKRVGLCYSCGATRPQCKGHTKEGSHCPNIAQNGGLCNGCGAPRTPKLCKRVTEGGSPCPNIARRGGFCMTHDPEPPVCQGVKDDGSPCTNRAISGGLCWTHGTQHGKCPCGRQRQACRKCNPLGNLVKRIRGAIRDCFKRRFMRNKPLGDPPDWLGCSWEYFFLWIENLFEAGMTWDNYGRGKGKWSFDHKFAFFDKGKTQPKPWMKFIVVLVTPTLDQCGVI